MLSILVFIFALVVGLYSVYLRIQLDKKTNNTEYDKLSSKVETAISDINKLTHPTKQDKVIIDIKRKREW